MSSTYHSFATHSNLQADALPRLVAQDMSGQNDIMVRSNLGKALDLVSARFGQIYCTPEYPDPIF